MTIRVDTTSLISGKVVVGDRGLGVSGATVRSETSTGTHGPGLMYNDWDSSADDSKQFRCLIITAPSSGTLFVNENGSFSLVGASDGVHTVVYRLFIDGVDLGTATATVTIGGGGTTYPLSISATLTLNGSVYKLASKAFNGVVTVSATPVVGMGLTANLSGSITLSSVLTDAVTFVRFYGSQINPTGTIVRATNKLLTGTISLTGSAFKGLFKVLTSSITAVGSLTSFKFTPEPGGILSKGLRFMRKFIGRR